MSRVEPSRGTAGRRARIGGLIVAGAIATGCATRFAPPGGPAEPVPAAEAQQVWTEVTAGCADLERFNAEVHPSGRLAGTRVRGLELLVAVDRSGRVGLEAVAGGQTAFTLRGATDAATLWLPREGRYIVAPAGRILAAVVGLDVEPSRLLSLFGGCVASDRRIGRADRVDGMLRVTTSDAVVYVEQRDGQWRIRGGTFGSFVADYRRWDEAWPASIGIRSVTGHEPAIDLQLAVEFRRINPDLPEAAFTVVVPPDAVPAALEDLRPFWRDGD